MLEYNIKTHNVLMWNDFFIYSLTYQLNILIMCLGTYIIKLDKFSSLLKLTMQQPPIQFSQPKACFYLI